MRLHDSGSLLVAGLSPRSPRGTALMHWGIEDAAPATLWVFVPRITQSYSGELDHGQRGRHYMASLIASAFAWTFSRLVTISSMSDVFPSNRFCDNHIVSWHNRSFLGH